MTNDNRASGARRVGAYVLSFGMVAAVAALVVAAILADGRPASESTTHDGGAWLLNRDEGFVGQVNRVVGEVSGVAGPLESGDFDVDEAGATIVVHERSLGQAKLLDPATHQIDLSFAVPAQARVLAASNAVVVHDPATGSVWELPTATLGEIQDVADVAPVVKGEAGTRAVLDATLRPVVFDEAGGSVSWVRRAGVAVAEGLEFGAQSIAMTAVGDDVVVAFDDGSISVVRPSGAQRFPLGFDLPVLQQPSPAAPFVSGIASDGRIVHVDLSTGAVEVAQQLDGAQPLDLINHAGCDWAVTLEPTPRFHFCGTYDELDGAGSELRLRLVNGWVWVNDATRGNVWFVNDELQLQQIDDWTAAINANDEENDEQNSEGGDEELVEDPNADELSDEVDQLDEDEQNESPQAEDDLARTRAGRPIVVDVLANDTDADGDPLLVRSIVAQGSNPDGTVVQVTPDGGGVQVQPAAGALAPITFTYEVHDGRGGSDIANVTVEVIPAEQNSAPVTQVDNATVRAGQSVTVNVLANDSDPDGDVLVLVGVTGDGSIIMTPGGDVTYRPSPTAEAGTVELIYDIVDDQDATATGTLRVAVRSEESNIPPIARNDVGTTAVGRTIVLDVLANDVDPDGDLLLAQNLQTQDGSPTSARLTPDGIFSFQPDAPGVYRFEYLASDGPETDVAQIRIDVAEVATNRPPTAVRDDVTLAVGQSRLVRVLDNDGDPDGDVVGLVGFVPVDGLEIVEVPGVGLEVTPSAAAAARSVVLYEISDGQTDPVIGVLVVSVTPQPDVDLPPIARDDVIEVRAGQSTGVPVLRNDYDPDGGSLEIAGPLADIPEGTLRIAPDRQSIILTAGVDQQFGFSFGYDVVDENDQRASAVVEVRIVPANTPNRAPIARPDVARTVSGTPVDIDVIINDTDPDGDPIVVQSIAQQPAHGEVTRLPDGRFQYTPRNDFSGTDRFVYTLVDGYTAPPGSEDGPLTSLGEVLIGVMPLPPTNSNPNAVDDIGPDVPFGSDAVLIDVLDNDFDRDFDRLTVTSTTPVTDGTVAITEGGRAISYTPPADGEPRALSFSYSIADGRGGADSALVTLQLVALPEPEPPVAVDDRVGPFRAGSTISFDPRANDFDPDGPQAALVVQPGTGYTVNAEGGISVTVDPAAPRLSYSVADQDGLISDPAVVEIIVTENEAPVIRPISLETAFGTPITIALHQFVTDADADGLSYTLGRNVTGGSARVLGQPAVNFLEVQFTPDPEFSGPASFDFTVDDQNGHSVSGTVRITVLPPENRPPVARNDSIQIRAGEPTPINLADLVTDQDVDEQTGDTLTFRIDGSSGSEIRVGSVTGSGVVTVESDVDAGGNTGSVSFTATDSFGESASGTVSITLETAADYAAPSAVADEGRTFQRAAVTVPVLTNDVDQSPREFVGEGLIVTAAGVTPAGTTAISGDGSQITFTPNSDFFGTATFNYTIQDGRRSTSFQSIGTVTVEVIGFPGEPLPPTVASVGNRYLVVNWQAPPSNGAPITNYRLEYQGSDGSRGVHELGSATTTYRWDGLTNAVAYRFQVTAENEAGFGDTSGLSLPGTPDIRPERPGTPTVTFGDGELDLQWAAAASQGSAVNNYEIEIGGGAAGQRQTRGAVTTLTWDGLTNGTNYQFRVRAQNSATTDNGGWSEWSDWSATENPLRNPAAPAAPVAVRGDRQVVITWGAPDNGGDPITSYELRRTGGGAWVRVTPQGAVNTYTWSDLANGAAVSFEVRAINRDPRSTTAAANVSPASNSVVPCGAPSAAAAPGVVTGDRQVTVSWVAPADAGCAIQNYTVRASSGASQTAPAGATSFVFTGLTNGTSYTFTVTANNEVTLANEQPARPSPASPAVVPVGPPFATTVTATPIAVGRVRLTWPAADGNGGPITFYEYRNGAGGWVNVGNVTTTEVGGLANNTGYTFQVRATNSAGPGAVSNTASVTTWGSPSAVSGFAAGAGDAVVNMSWAAPGSNGGTGITRYEAKITTGGSCDDGGSSQFTAGSPASFGASNGQSYRACVRAENAVGWGPWSGAVVTPQAPPPPVQPSITITTGGTGANGNGVAPCAGCFWINVTLENFAPNTTYGVTVPNITNRTWNVTTNGAGYGRIGDGYWFCGNPFDAIAYAGGRESPRYICQ